jgi:hypothetical protein
MRGLVRSYVTLAILARRKNSVTQNVCVFRIGRFDDKMYSLSLMYKFQIIIDTLNWMKEYVRHCYGFGIPWNWDFIL